MCFKWHANNVTAIYNAGFDFGLKPLSLINLNLNFVKSIIGFDVVKLGSTI